MADERYSTEEPKLIVFSDIDGTLIDKNTYSFEDSEEAVDILKSRGIPLVLASAKTRAEQEHLRTKLSIHDPFIVEDGGAVFIGEGYFPFKFPYHRNESGYCVIEFGQSYAKIRSAVESFRNETGIKIKGYGDLSIKEVSDVTGLDHEASGRAKTREYQETIVTGLKEEEIERLRDHLAKFGLRLSFGGKFLSVLSGNDKGLAVSLLIDFYRLRYPDIKTVAIGDSLNDIPMLKKADIPVLVQKPDLKWENIDIENLKRVEGAGPRGWSAFIKELILN
jgi:mannosyl-3-phosphoglycerate phosphatase